VRLNKSWCTALTRGIREPWALSGAKFSIRPNFCATLRKTNRRILQGGGSVSETCPKITGSFSWFFFHLFRISLPLRTSIALTQKLGQNTSYMQLSGMNNWFCVVITIFAQHLNIFRPKLVEWRRLLPPLGDASSNCNSYWWLLCGFEAFVATANPSTTHARSTAWGVALRFFWGFVIVYNELKNDFMGRLELDFGGILCEFGGLSPLLSTSVEKCHNFF